MRGPPSKKGSLYLLSYFIFYFGLLLPFFWIVRRYTSLISTLALPWASLGFIGLTEWITPRLKEGRWKRTFPALFLLFVLVVIFIQGRVIRRDHRLMQKEVGLWMKDHLARESRIMSRLPQEAFYSEMAWVRMPEKSYEEILQIARSHHIRYVIVDERVMLYVPNFLEKAKDKRELQEVYGLRREGRWVTVFKLIDPPKER
jgi:hypothetical protein